MRTTVPTGSGLEEFAPSRGERGRPPPPAAFFFARFRARLRTAAASFFDSVLPAVPPAAAESVVPPVMVDEGAARPRAEVEERLPNKSEDRSVKKEDECGC